MGVGLLFDYVQDNIQIREYLFGGGGGGVEDQHVCRLCVIKCFAQSVTFFYNSPAKSLSHFKCFATPQAAKVFN